MIHRLKNIKLIVIDIDGTLVDTKGRIGEKTLHLARKLKKLGIFCTLSSARSFHYSADIAEILDVHIPFVTLDGALIKDLQGNVIYKGILKRKLIEKVIKLSENNYGKIALCDEFNLLVTPGNAVVKEYAKVNAPIKEIPDYSEIDSILELLIFCEDKSSMRAIKSNIKFPHSIGISMNVTKSPTHEYYLLTVKKKGSDKLESVKRLVKNLGLKRKNVAVIGDWHNDMPLFDYGAYNIAVQNAIPELKRKADYLTESTNNEDAVGEVLELVHEFKLKATN